MEMSLFSLCYSGEDSIIMVALLKYFCLYFGKCNVMSLFLSAFMYFYDKSFVTARDMNEIYEDI